MIHKVFYLKPAIFQKVFIIKKNNMQQDQKIGQGYFKALSILHLALVMGQVLFGAVAVFLRMSGGFNTDMPELRDVFIYLVPVVIIAAIIAGNTIFKSRLAAAKEKGSLTEKLNDYRAALIVRYALLEGPSLLAIIAYLLTGELLFICIAGMAIIIFFILRPSKERLVKDLDLSTAETNILNDAG